MTDKINCPNCGHSFDVEEALTGKLEAHFKEEYEKKIAEQTANFIERKKQLEKEKDRLNIQKETQDELIKIELAKAIELEREKIVKNAFESYEVQIKSLEEENRKRKSENKTLREKEVELMRQEAELKEKQEELELQIEKKLLEKQKEIENKARAKERESFELEKVKLLKQIDDNKRLAEEMK